MHVSCIWTIFLTYLTWKTYNHFKYKNFTAIYIVGRKLTLCGYACFKMINFSFLHFDRSIIFHYTNQSPYNLVIHFLLLGLTHFICRICETFRVMSLLYVLKITHTHTHTQIKAHVFHGLSTQSQVNIRKCLTIVIVLTSI